MSSNFVVVVVKVFINDWQSSFLLDSALRDSSRYEDMIEENPIEPDPLVSKITQLLVSRPEQLLMQQSSDSTSVTRSIRSLLTAAVVTRRDPQPAILGSLMQQLVSEASQLSLVVPEEVYLPSPPIYCPQLVDLTSEVHEEMTRRSKLSCVLKEIMVVFEASRLHVTLIKWYLANLVEAADIMKNNLGVNPIFNLI